MKKILSILLLSATLTSAAQAKGNYQKGDYGYLFCHMNDRGRAWTAYALSRDGFHYHDLLNGDSIFSDAEHARIEGATRDAYIFRKHDGSGYLMLCTDMNVGRFRDLKKQAEWDNYGICLLRSNDLLHWESVSFDYRKGREIFSDPKSESVYKDWSTINRVWAPQAVWDADYLWPDGKKGGYFVYYSMWNRAEERYDRMYYSYADESFTKLTQPRLLFDWGYATIDADINWVDADKKWHMMIKKEGGTPGLFTSEAPTLTSPWPEPKDDDYVNFEGKKKCEGVSAFQLAGQKDWIIGYIEYSSRPKNYRLCLADKTMHNFREPRNIEGVSRPQHGSFLRITKEEYERLQAWSDARINPVKDFDLTKSQPLYDNTIGYGYDLQPAPDRKNPSAPFYFSVQVPDGNYRVKVVLGGKKNSCTYIRAEGRRLMIEDVKTKNAKETKTVEFVVNKRTPYISKGKEVKIKPREKDYLTWDDKLTLEFNGPMPAVRSIHIEPAGDIPTVYLCGNSTVVDQSYEPWASWGQLITRWFGPNVAISNHAESGLTCRSFINSNRLEKILQTLKKGDYVFVEFGHNDEKEHAPGDGPWYHYQYQLKQFVDQVRSREATIVFCTPTQRRSFESDGKTLKNTHGDFPAAMKEVARRENVPLIDLNAMTKTLFEAYGQEESKHFLVHYPANTYPGQTKALQDNTHFNPFGASQVAKCVVMGIKQLQLPLAEYLRLDWHDFDPASPDDWKAFKWPLAPMFENKKPDGN